MKDDYPFLVPLNLSVWKNRQSAIRGTIDLPGARDLESVVIDRRTGEIVYEWKPRGPKRPTPTTVKSVWNSRRCFCEQYG